MASRWRGHHWRNCTNQDRCSVPRGRMSDSSSLAKENGGMVEGFFLHDWLIFEVQFDGLFRRQVGR